MYYNQQQPHGMQEQMNVQYRTFIDPFVVNRLQSVIGKVLIVQTTNDTIRGKLTEVQPDHVALVAGDSTFFVRIQQIVSIMPDS